MPKVNKAVAQTKKEEIIKRRSLGKSGKQIAIELGLSETYVFRILQKNKNVVIKKDTLKKDNIMNNDEQLNKLSNDSLKILLDRISILDEKDLIKIIDISKKANNSNIININDNSSNNQTNIFINPIKSESDKTRLQILDAKIKDKLKDKIKDKI